MDEVDACQRAEPTVTKIDLKELSWEHPPLLVACYVRVSTEKERQEGSLENQREHYESLIQANPAWTYAGTFCDDGISAASGAKRQGLADLVEACHRGEVQLILTKSISRLWRNTTQLLELCRELSSLGVCVYFENEQIHTGNLGEELFLTIRATLAQGDSASISQNVKWGIQKRFLEGTYRFSRSPYGYRLVDGKHVVIPEEAEVVRQIFDLALSGEGAVSIAQILNSQGITNRGKVWHYGTVGSMLHNEAYVGDVLLQKTWSDEHFHKHRNHGEVRQYYMDDHHEGIVSREIFEEVAARVEGTKGMVRQESAPSRHPFSGRIFCDCGSSMKRQVQKCMAAGQVAGRIHLWCCTRHLKDRKACPKKAVKEEFLENAFISLLHKLSYLSSPTLLEAYAQLQKKEEQFRYAGELDKLNAYLDRSQAQKQELSHRLSLGLLSPRDYQQGLVVLEAEAGLAKARINRFQKIMTMGKPAREAQQVVSSYGADQLGLWEAFDQLVERVTVGKDEAVFLLRCGLSLAQPL